MMRLPKPAETNVTYERRYIGSVYTAEQMRKYAAKAVAKEREACAEMLDAVALACNSVIVRRILQQSAQAIRARKWL
jgi:hypothetical protein